MLLTQGGGTQLYLLFNHGGSGPAPRGEVLSYARLKPTGPQTPIPGIAFGTLFNPVALCAGGNGAGAVANRIFILDQGDTCLARANPSTGLCDDPTGGWKGRVRDLGLYWRVREYGLLGGDTLSTFTDTTMAFVNGVAADAQGRVYVSGAAIVDVPDAQDPRLKTRTFLWRIRRYLRGPRYPGIYDYFMPGANWHVDTTWVVRDGSGTGTVQDPRGIFWGPSGGGALYCADLGKNWVQTLSDLTSSTGLSRADQADGLSLYGPLDVVADPPGFVYVADTGNQRVVRFDGAGGYVQTVNVERDAFQRPLVEPVTLAVDDSLVFVGDAGLAEVIRYKRRP
jgi:DNA-binding beta-propeller fold protein YncE